MATEETLTWPQALNWRMRRQHLTGRLPRHQLLDVTSRLCGVHAQLQSSAELTLWVRVDDLQPGDVGDALWQARSLVKTWAMRGTLHLLPAAEYGLWQSALSAFRNYEKASWSKYFGVSQKELEVLFEAVPRALDDRFLTRDELADAVTSLTGSADLGDRLRESWGAVLKPMSYRGLLCYGPSQGRNTRFTLPATWLDHWTQWQPAEAVAEMVRRYLGAYAPATREELSRWWGGATPAQAGKLLKQLGDEVAEVDVEGERRYVLAEHLADMAAATPERVVRLLPAFDQWVVTAPRGHDAFLASEYHARVYRSQGWLSPVLLVDGRMEGTWSYEGSGEKLRVTIEPFTSVPASVLQEAEAEAERAAAFLGKDAADTDDEKEGV
ncbi:MAG TPA: winged helix DNA-binding domain-containing protein [Anaerolineae bacterium]|nr:winged helix DNA-binding domain-containing protein [Anaerolineae bacterium]